MKKIGTKVYYCLVTGNVIKIMGDMEGFVKETSFDDDFKIYPELKERDKDSVALMKFEYGEFAQKYKHATGFSVDLDSKELKATFEKIEVEDDFIATKNITQDLTQIEERLNELEKENSQIREALKTLLEKNNKKN